MKFLLPCLQKEEFDYAEYKDVTRTKHLDYHLSFYYEPNYKGRCEADYWFSRLCAESTTAEPPKGDYIYICFSREDYRKMCMDGEDFTTDKVIRKLLKKRENYVLMNMHFTARDALAHYIGLVQAGLENDQLPQLLCTSFDYEHDLELDGENEYDKTKFGAFNRHYQE